MTWPGCPEHTDRTVMRLVLPTHDVVLFREDKQHYTRIAEWCHMSKDITGPTNPVDGINSNQDNRSELIHLHQSAIKYWFIHNSDRFDWLISTQRIYLQKWVLEPYIIGSTKGLDTLDSQAWHWQHKWYLITTVHIVENMKTLHSGLVKNPLQCMLQSTML